MDEALRDANRCPLPLTEWAAVKNGLSQQQTDFENPLLTTSCTFEDLFQQGSRPASEIAYSRSDYDGWKWWTTWHQCQKDTPVLEVAREIDAFQNALFQLPIFHEIIPINMNTLKLEVSRSTIDSLITKDRMRVDVVVAFFVRVKPSVEGIATAAQTLGQRTLSPEDLRMLVEDKFVDALRATAAQMTMHELQDTRENFVKGVGTYQAVHIVFQQIPASSSSIETRRNGGLQADSGKISFRNNNLQGKRDYRCHIV